MGWDVGMVTPRGGGGRETPTPMGGGAEMVGRWETDGGGTDGAGRPEEEEEEKAATPTPPPHDGADPHPSTP